MSFDPSAYMHETITTVKIIKYPSPPNFPPVPWSIPPLSAPTPSPGNQHLFQSLEINSHFLELYLNGIIQYVLFLHLALFTQHNV